MRLDPNVELAPSNMVLAEAFTTDDHSESEFVYYQSEDEKQFAESGNAHPASKRMFGLLKN